ncbi:MAG: TIM44-like domain-containing protein [Candidatus Riflebacteria bacterium]|nr:TIM44-like domain-containing protein [Candidatus Riflebacteria bacterium]
MRLTRGQFKILLVLLFALAGLMAFWYQQEMSREMPADIAYLFGLGMVVVLCLRAEFWVGALVSVYAGSLLFVFFYLLVAPLEAPVLLALFFWPTYLWQKKRLKGRPFALCGLGLSALCWLVIRRPAVPFLLFPVLQLVATRVAGRVRPRYTRFTCDLGVSLSHAQRKQLGNRGWREEGDWFDLLQVEFEKFPQRVAEVWQGLTGDTPRQDADEEKGPNAGLLHLQKAALMSRALTDLTRRDPAFRIEDFLKRVDQLFWKVQNAWYDQQIGALEPVIADALFEQFRLQVAEQQAAGIRFRHQAMTIYENRAVQVNTDPNFDIVHVYLRASSADSLIDLKTGETLAEEEHRRQFSEYWTFIRRPSAQTLARPGLLEGHCPNCSAPLEIGQATVCRVCGSFIRSGAHDWVLAKITQACEWEYLEPDSLPGWRDLVTADPALSIQQIEDRGGVLFWMFRQAERERKAEAIARFALPAFRDRFAARLQHPDPQGWCFHENVALGSVRLRGATLAPDLDRVFLLVVWSGIPVFVKPDGQVDRDSQTPCLMRDVFILGRRHGRKTDDRMTLSSAHCPQCGGPLASTFSVQCPYCSTILNEGEAGWILERVASEFDPEVQRLRAAAAAATPSPGAPSASPGLVSDRGTDLVFVMIQMALADGRIDPPEMKLLREAAAGCGIREPRLQAMIREMQAGRVHVPEVGSPEAAKGFLQAAARVALADGTLDPAEEQSFHRLAKLLGYSEADVKQILGQEWKRKYQAGVAQAAADPGKAGAPPLPAAGGSEPASAGREPTSDGAPDGGPPAGLDVLQVAVQVLLADGKESPAELDLLARMAASFGVGEARLRAMIAAVRRGEVRLPVPATPREALNLLSAAARMAWADGEVSVDEERALMTLASHLGYSRIDLRRILAKARS